MPKWLAVRVGVDTSKWEREGALRTSSVECCSPKVAHHPLIRSLKQVPYPEQRILARDLRRLAASIGQQVKCDTARYFHCHC
jgi:hypothetical protein